MEIDIARDKPLQILDTHVPVQDLSKIKTLYGCGADQDGEAEVRFEVTDSKPLEST